MPAVPLLTLEDVAALLPGVLRTADTFIVRRAVLADRLAQQRSGREHVLPELKALEAELSELLDGLTSAGIQIKGTAPLLLDFPVSHDGRTVLLCWLEGDREVAWYHAPEHGFLGRRPLSELGLPPVQARDAADGH